MQNQPRKLLDQVRDAIRTKHYAYRTEQSYVDWIKRYVLFHKKRHPAEMGAPEVQAFITYLAVDRQLSASTQNQALSAILFLYKYVLQKDVALPLNLVRAERPSRLPTVLTHDEALAVIGIMGGNCQLMATIVRERFAPDGMPPAPRQGPGFWQPSDRRS